MTTMPAKSILKYTLPLMAGSLFLCISQGVHAHDSGEHLQGEGDYIEESAADALLKMLLTTSHAAASITVSGNKRIITANGYPDTRPGRFPNRGNPHQIEKKSYHLSVPLNPSKRRSATQTSGKPFGISIDGVLFDPGTAETWQNDRNSGWNYEAMGGACKLGLDKNKAHVQPDGTYHYHALSPSLLKASGGRKTPALIGYAADGFPVYGTYGYSDPQAGGKVRKLKSSFVRIVLKNSLF